MAWDSWLHWVGGFISGTVLGGWLGARVTAWRQGAMLCALCRAELPHRTNSHR